MVVARHSVLDMQQGNQDIDESEEIASDTTSVNLIQSVSVDRLSNLGEEFDQDTQSLQSLESVNLRKRQELLNRSHLFGIRIWKPALYKKKRSVEEIAEGDIHSSPTYERATSKILIGNALWVFLFGWWMFLIFLIPTIILLLISTINWSFEFPKLLFGLCQYTLFPFSKYLEFVHKANSSTEGDHVYANLDQDELLLYPQRSLDIDYTIRTRSSGHDTESMNRANTQFNEMLNMDSIATRTARRNFKRNKLKKFLLRVQKITFFLMIYTIIAPILLTVSAICWLLIYPLPMALICYNTLRYLIKFPYNLQFRPNGSQVDPDSIHYVLLCTQKATNGTYFKYTIDGINIVYVNLLFVAAITIFSYLAVGIDGESTFLMAKPFFYTTTALISTVPLAYIIGQGVASISAQSSMGLGAVMHAFFGSVVDVYLNFSFLKKGKAKIVEGCLIGSIIAGTLLLPGLSMCFGAANNKIQKFNLKSASVTSLMLLFAAIGCFAPSIFFVIFAPYQVSCITRGKTESQLCNYTQIPDLNTAFYTEKLKPFALMCGLALMLSYFIGLSFTLVTHAAHIWHGESVHSIQNLAAAHNRSRLSGSQKASQSKMTALRTYNNSSGGIKTSKTYRTLNQESQTLQNDTLMIPRSPRPKSFSEELNTHDTPNWSRRKSTIILITGTTVFTFVAEILVRAVAIAFEKHKFNEKLLGTTLFALAPLATEIINAILFAQQGNVALSLEIGSAYVVQVILLQIPVILLLSELNWLFSSSTVRLENIFSMIFPKWDIINTILSVILLSNVYNEGASNYFKGSILLLAYLVAIFGYVYEPYL